jgi:hypothetical protein
VTVVAGGTVTSADGKATIVFAPGAAASDLVVTITISGSPPAGVTAASAVYDLSAIDASTGAAVDIFRDAPHITIAFHSSTGLVPHAV